ncbi:MAG: hypothetical protein F9K29_15630 [Hyphomicrobiaceae bacterium]|nr:MAG: hypothetical protein F9K29_15630 [Hyphomicrobiaceae bacterium]
MTRFQEEEQLLTQLRQAFGAGGRGYSAQFDWPSGVVILSRGQFRGIWRSKDGAYSFTPGGYGTATYSAMSAQEAVRFTLEHVCKDARQKSPSI